MGEQKQSPHQSMPERFRVRARNVTGNAENRIHDDDVARRYGFAGGLVDGTRVYAFLTRPLAARFGTDWLARSIADLALLRPVYDGDTLEVIPGPLDESEPEAGLRVRCTNEAGEEVALLEARLPRALPPPDARAGRAPSAPVDQRPPVSWERLVVDAPFRALHWRPTPADNARWCESVAEPLALYTQGGDAPVHPGLVLQAANDVFTHNFRLEPWLHVASHIVQRGAIRAGETVEVRAVPTDKWERRGHQFVNLYVAMLVEGTLRVEVGHKAIFRVRPAA